ncbi:metal-sulfur cluster assembly factor [Aerococcus sanguinicola]|uniref:Aromatic ring hydroxylase n=1 Tax=Aerococcus sanguinicola TaxID=119206 RepID=A0A0X8FCX0_9LACT|nr:aromatic ring hydroxylase [Aerococcus sanguinicola]OFT97162.1 aromatic ring hydroxylase [Aerococcus sp. HMSC23C02]
MSLRDPELYEDVLAACQEVIDPELGIDIYNLGLIYDLLYDGDGHLWVRMTLTMPGCPLADVIFQTLMDKLREIEVIQDVKVELVWQPIWSPDRLTRYARIALGLR